MVVFFHSGRSNRISELGSVAQNECTLRESHQNEKFSFLSEVYENKIFLRWGYFRDILGAYFPSRSHQKIQKIQFFRIMWR